MMKMNAATPEVLVYCVGKLFGIVWIKRIRDSTDSAIGVEQVVLRVVGGVQIRYPLWDWFVCFSL